MYCPTCQLALIEMVEVCPTCGEPMRAIEPTDAVRSVEGVAHGESLPGDDVEMSASGARSEPSLLPAISRSGDTRVMTRLPRLTALVWSQPKVRAAVRTGAGAVALSLAMRAASRVLSDRRSRSVASRATASLLGERPRSRPQGDTLAPLGGEIFEVMETYISVRSVRRIVRR